MDYQIIAQAKGTLPRFPPGTVDDMMQIGFELLNGIPDNIIAFLVLGVAYLTLIPIVMVFIRNRASLFSRLSVQLFYKHTIHLHRYCSQNTIVQRKLG
jgi:hypothetical protein